MIRQMNHRESRFVAVMILAVLLVAVFLLIEPLWQRYSENQLEISSLSDRLNRFQGIARQRLPLKARLDKYLLEYQSKGFFLEGDTPGLAVADLQTTVRKIVDQSGARLISTQAVGSLNPADHSVKVRVKTEGDIDDIREILLAIETSPMVLVMDKVSVQKNRRKRFSVRGGQKPLQLNFDLTAYVSGVAK